jgi:hypothetical protein
MKIFLAVLALIIAILFAPMLLSPTPDNRQGESVKGLPWQIEVLPNGTSRVFDLELGRSTLADAKARFGEGEIALVAAPGEAESLEFYFDNVMLGNAILGKMVVTAELSQETIAEMRKRTVRTEYMQSTTKKSVLDDVDLPIAYAAPISGLAFVPSVNLDEVMIIQRFGKPTERAKSGETLEHFLYPDKGLDVRLDSEGKEVLQYVAPRNFSRLSAPLKAKAEKQ